MRRGISETDFYASFQTVKLNRPDFKVGDKVFISDLKHPAKRQTGTVVVAPRMISVIGNLPALWAEVEIDGWAGHRCGAQPNQMRKLS